MNEIIVYEDKNIIIIDNIPEYSIQDYDLFDEKDFKKYIIDIEKTCRNSFEYRNLINYLRQYMNMNKCSFFENVSNENTFKIKIHIHHCPFNLYEICLTVYNKRMFYQEDTSVELVAKEVMYIHYSLMIGLIPLAETVHELVHNEIMFIPLNSVMGNYEYFIEVYGRFIPGDTMNKFEYMKSQTEVYNEAANTAILEQKPLFIELPHGDEIGTYNIPSMEKIIDLMDEKIKEIKETSNIKQIESQSIYYDNNEEDITYIQPVYYDDSPIIPVYYDNDNI